MKYPYYPLSSPSLKTAASQGSGRSVWWMIPGCASTTYPPGSGSVYALSLIDGARRFWALPWGRSKARKWEAQFSKGVAGGGQRTLGEVHAHVRVCKWESCQLRGRAGGLSQTPCGGRKIRDGSGNGSRWVWAVFYGLTFALDSAFLAFGIFSCSLLFRFFLEPLISFLSPISPRFKLGILLLVSTVGWRMVALFSSPPSSDSQSPHLSHIFSLFSLYPLSP
ncbi:hypothetical protein HOY80DRAFT_521098 [Tuber brumale]|nr:hypothetical protein HOY80DRAFT_521098 [Tuber brumale]